MPRSCQAAAAKLAAAANIALSPSCCRRRQAGCRCQHRTLCCRCTSAAAVVPFFSIVIVVAVIVVFVAVTFSWCWLFVPPPSLLPPVSSLPAVRGGSTAVVTAVAVLPQWCRAATALPPRCQTERRRRAVAATTAAPLSLPPCYCHRPAAAMLTTNALLPCCCRRRCHRLAATRVAAPLPLRTPSMCAAGDRNKSVKQGLSSVGNIDQILPPIVLPAKRALRVLLCKFGWISQYLHRKHNFCMSSCVCLRQCTKMDF